MAAPVAGIIQELLLEDGGRVLAGDELCRIKITGAMRCISVDDTQRILCVYMYTL